VEELLRSSPALGPWWSSAGWQTEGRLAAAPARPARDPGPVFTLGDPDAYRGDAAGNGPRAGGRTAARPLSLAGAVAALSCPGEGRDGRGCPLGTGSRGRWRAAARAVEAVNKAGRPVVAADLPSGLRGHGAPSRCGAVRAGVTVVPRPAHVWPARGCGRVIVREIGIPRRALSGARRRSWPRAETSSPASRSPRRFAQRRFRAAGCHRSRGKAGAAVPRRGAPRAGAGLVTVFCPAS
jgi:hypothetical protein